MKHEAVKRSRVVQVVEGAVSAPLFFLDRLLSGIARYEYDHFGSSVDISPDGKKLTMAIREI